MLFDFEWANKNLYYGLYARTCSFFEGSELSACGRPADERERQLLAAFPGAVSTTSSRAAGSQRSRTARAATAPSLARPSPCSRPPDGK